MVKLVHRLRAWLTNLVSSAEAEVEGSKDTAEVDNGSDDDDDDHVGTERLDRITNRLGHTVAALRVLLVERIAVTARGTLKLAVLAAVVTVVLARRGEVARLGAVAHANRKVVVVAANLDAQLVDKEGGVRLDHQHVANATTAKFLEGRVGRRGALAVVRVDGVRLDLVLRIHDDRHVGIVTGILQKKQGEKGERGGGGVGECVWTAVVKGEGS